MEKMMVFGILILSLVLIAGCQPTGEEMTAEELEATSQESALAGEAVVMGCKSRATTSCEVIDGGIKINRRTPLLSGCKSAYRGSVYEYSCPTSTSYGWCITRCESGCNIAAKQCNELISVCGNGVKEG